MSDSSIHSAPYADTFWEDFVVPTTAIRLPGVNPATYTSYMGGEVLTFANNATNICYFNIQMPHKWKVGSTIYPHAHIVSPATDADNVYWTFTYSWGNIGGVFPSETTANYTATGTVQDTQAILSLHGGSGVDGTGKTLSSILICSLTRTGGHASDTSTTDIYVPSIDIHYEIDMPGSRDILTK